MTPPDKNPLLELSIIAPTFNEKDNLTTFLSTLAKNLDAVHWEVIFVDDDSPDGTASAVKSLAQTDSRVRCVHRIGRRGLSSACIEGALASAAPFIAVMDADLQHDASILPVMLSTIKENNLDIVVGSRYVQGGTYQNWSQFRLSLSRLATSLSQILLKVSLTDPMSGYFLMRRESFEKVVRNLSGVGFKILLDIFASSSYPLKFKEIPFTFRNRLRGESKLDLHVTWDYLMLLGDKFFHRKIPIRFLSFSIIGGLGVAFHLAVLTTFLKGFSFNFSSSQTIATLAAIVVNFTLNNLLTYQDRRLSGWRWAKGLLSFYIVCGLGAFANIAVSTYLFNAYGHWVLAALSGICIGAVWNYALSSFYTWD